MLPKMIVRRSTLLGKSVMSSSPAAKNVVKTTPIVASSRMRVRDLMKPIAGGGEQAGGEGPTENGSPRM